MRQREKYGRLSEADRVEIGDRIKNGQTHAEIAAAVGCSTKSVQRLLIRTGGLAPRGRNRSPHHLTVAEREEISRGLTAGDSYRAIAGRPGRAPSTISREVAANGSRERYRAWRAERRAAGKARRPKVAKLARCPRLRRKVERLLAERRSPRQIAHRLRLDHPSDPEMRVSHETIHQSLYVQTRGALGKELTACLRTGRTRRRSPRHRPGEGRPRAWSPSRAARRDRGPGRAGPLGRGPDPGQAGDDPRSESSSSAAAATCSFRTFPAGGRPRMCAARRSSGWSRCRTSSGAR